MNLEVVRSRAARGGADVACVSSFADSAAGELERAVELVQALLELARPLTAPVDLWSVLRPLVTLHHTLAMAGAAGAGAGGNAEGELSASVTLEARGGAALYVATDPVLARAALASALQAAASSPPPVRVRCSVKVVEGEEQVAATLRCVGPAPPMESSVRDIIEKGGVRFETVPDGITLFFRAARRD